MTPKINEYYYCKKTTISGLNNKNGFKKGNHYKSNYMHHGEIIMSNDIGYIIFSLEKYMIYDYFLNILVQLRKKEKIN